MSSAPDEFLRALSKPFGDTATEDAPGLPIADRGTVLHFALTGEAPQRIGTPQPVAPRVKLTVRQGDEGAASEPLSRIDRAMQRGGG